MFFIMLQHSFVYCHMLYNVFFSSVFVRFLSNNTQFVMVCFMRIKILHCTKHILFYPLFILIYTADLCLK